MPEKTSAKGGLDISDFRPEDAPGVVALFRVVYGDDYPIKDYYNPDWLIAANESGRVLTTVARDGDGAVIGQAACFQSSPPNKGLYEFGQMLILPEKRGGTTAFRLAAACVNRAVGRPGVEGIFGEAVTNHLVTQKMTTHMKFQECGIELALMPAGAYEREGAGEVRVSVMQGARVIKDRGGELHLPARDREALEAVLSGFGLDRLIHWDEAAIPRSGEPTRIDPVRYDYAGVRRAHVFVVGPDFDARLAELDDQGGDLAVDQWYLDAADPATPAAVDALRARGFVFGGFMPLWFGADALFYQKLRVKPDFEAIKLHAEMSKRLLAVIKAEYEALT